MSNAQHTPGPWMVATSNSWRRILGARSESVCEPIKQNDGHPDLYFRNGGADGPDARLIAAAPDLLEACKRLLGCMALANWEGDPTAEFARAAIAKASPSVASVIVGEEK